MTTPLSLTSASFEPAPSNIESAGNGLFISKGRVKRGEILCLYSGKELSTEEVRQRGKDGFEMGYLMRLGFRGPGRASKIHNNSSGEGGEGGEGGGKDGESSCDEIDQETVRKDGIVWIDAFSCENVLARYINDPRSPLAYNAEFRKIPFAHPPHAEVTALRDIEEGEEIFVSYGRWYWGPGREWGKKMTPMQIGAMYSKLKKPPENNDARALLELARKLDKP